MPALVIQYLVPFSTYESPSRTARVFMAATSEPASGSLKQYDACDSPDAIRGRYRCLRSSEPQLMTGIMPSFEISIIRLVDAQARDSSSTMIAWVTWSAPVPPYSTGMPRAGSSMDRQASKLSHGYSPVSSTSAARGAILSSQNWRSTARNSCCSSVSVIGCTPSSLPPRHAQRVPRMLQLLAGSYKLDPRTTLLPGPGGSGLPDPSTGTPA